MNGMEQVNANKQQALSYAGSHAGIFNTSSNPSAPIVQLTAEEILDKAIDAMNSNPDFILEVVVTPPPYSLPSAECEDFVQEYVDELENVIQMI